MNKVIVLFMAEPQSSLASLRNPSFVGVFSSLYGDKGANDWAKKHNEFHSNIYEFHYVWLEVNPEWNYLDIFAGTTESTQPFIIR